MINTNKYSSWYDKHKEENVTSPYKVVKIENDQSMPMPGLENITVEALSAAQARHLFLQRYTKLSDYLNMGIKIEVELDNEKLRQRKQIEEMEAQQEEEFIQDAWWNK